LKALKSLHFIASANRVACGGGGGDDDDIIIFHSSKYQCDMSVTTGQVC
jgi:hypothetical protein